MLGSLVLNHQSIFRKECFMRTKLVWVVCGMFLVMVGCAARSHFGIPDQSLSPPSEFDQTEAAIASAEKSPGAQYCPDKIAQAKQKGKRAAEVYWVCHTNEAMALLADARKLAKEAESCQAPPKAAPAPAPAPTSPPPAPPAAPARQPISFHSVYFDFNKSDLKPKAKAELDRAAAIMKDNPDVVLELQGNTDAIGTDAYNKALGEKRAKAVFGYLKSKGIHPSRLKAVSFGKTKPVAPNTTAEGRAQNRRVDMVILK
jgi:outer membrane protein OmpA-like peptidoglycan-associated protein